METIENVDFSFGELQSYILIRDKDLTGKNVELLVTDKEVQLFRERAERMAHIIPKKRKKYWLFRWFIDTNAHLIGSLTVIR